MDGDKMKTVNGTEEETLKNVQQAVYIIWLSHFSEQEPSFLKWYNDNFIKLEQQ